MEQWDLYDIHRMKTGETWVRGQEMREGNLHLVVHICVFKAKIRTQNCKESLMFLTSGSLF